MTEPSGERPARSPAKVAVMAFGAVVLVGIVIAAVVGGIRGEPGVLSSFERGQEAGKAITPVALVAAAIGYFAQKRRLETRS